MLQVRERELSEDDRSKLGALVSKPQSPFVPFTEYAYGLQIIGETWGFLILVVVFTWGRAWGALAITTAVFIAWWLICFRARILDPLSSFRDDNKRAKEFGDIVRAASNVSSTYVESERVVQVDCYGGTFYLFEVGEALTYWVDPRGMLPGDTPKRWPVRRFEVFRVDGVEGEIGPVPLGQRLRPVQVIEYSELFPDHDYEVPDDGVIHSALDDFIEEHKRGLHV